MKSLEEALKEAYAHAPVDDIVMETVEILHKDFVDTLRFHNGLKNIQAKLEDSAPKNAGKVVTFTRALFGFKQPSQGISPTPEAVLEISNITSDIMSELDKAMHSFTPIDIIYRMYTEKTLLAGPQLTPPPRFQVVAVSGGGGLKVSLRPVDLTKIRFPKELYQTS